MALPWLGFVTPVIDVDPVALDGPDPLGSAAYAGDYAEVRTLGAVDSAGRSAEQTAVARFVSGNRSRCTGPPCATGSRPSRWAFRDAMEDGYLLGHTTADRVIQAIR
jgi:hypothetical protein